MKTADEMFEKLGYKKEIDNSMPMHKEIIYFKNSDYASNIKFVINNKLVKAYYGEEEKNAYIDMEILQAINKKCQELGWI